MKKIQFFMVAILLQAGGASMAQNIDMKKMERDIAVAENILGTLISDGSSISYWGSSIKGSYVNDYGVIFSLPMHSIIDLGRSTVGFSYRTTGEDVVVFGGDNGNVVSVNVPKVEAKKVNADSLAKAQQVKLVEAMKIFLADYGTLISQLNENQKILITNRNSNFRWAYENNASELSVEGKIQDLQAFKNGKISRAQLMEKIKITNRVSSEEKSTDLELLSSIMGRLYRSDLSDTYYTNGNIYYDRLADFGVIYRMQVYSSTSESNAHKIITRKIDNLTQEERNEIVKEMYPDFINGLKDNILEYGKTVKSLKDDEILLFEVVMTKCEGCDLPQNLEIAVKGKTLKDLSAGKLSKAEALKAVTLTEGAKQ